MSPLPLQVITRFAPSPTGHLHRGHALHMLWVSEVARQLGGRVLYRLEDHDIGRCREDYIASIGSDIRWFSSLFQLSDHGSVPTWRQSNRTSRYQEILDRCLDANLVYACDCSRQDIASATDQTSGELRYLGTCRDKKIPVSSPGTALRLKIPDQTISATDFKHGPIEQNPATMQGDVVIRDRDGHWTYQWCVVIDDIDQNINLIIRGDDLLSSIGRQLAMRKLILPLLQMEPRENARPLYFLHHPLLLDDKGHKLSKRHFSESIGALRQQGWTALQVLSDVTQEYRNASKTEPLNESDISTLIPSEIITLARKVLDT